MSTHSKPFILSRRTFLAAGGALAATGAVSRASASTETQGAASAPQAKDAPKSAGPFQLPPLPWKDDALAPIVSAQTISFHYGKHHKAYFDNLNKLADGKKWATMKLEEVVAAASKENDTAVFNNAAQAWNHTFYWNCLKPGAGAPSGKLADQIKADFGGVDALKKELVEAGKTQFGSGWAWLVLEDKKLKVIKTGNADTPIAHGGKPLLTLDVWEHAYYLDYQNKRPDYLQALVDKLLNWEFAAANMG